MPNYCTLSSIAKYDSTVSLSQGNLRCDIGSTGGSRVFGTHYMTSGKWYCEIVNYIATNYHHPGIHSYGTTPGAITNDSTNGRIVWRNDGNVYIDGSLGATITSFGSGDVIGIAVDMDNGKLYYYKNGTNVSGSGHSITGYQTRGYTFHGLYNANAGWTRWNFGQFPFQYDPPSGFVALSTENLPEPTISTIAVEKPEDHFNVVTYTGNGGTLSVPVGFAPDFVWIKNRSNSFNHRLYDIIRGNSRALQSNQTNAESTYGAMSFESDGFAFTSDAQQSHNTNGDNYVAWCWKAGGTAVENTDGSITSQVSANTEAGFSIFSYTGTGAAGTVGHGLGGKPDLIIFKGRNTTSDWPVYNDPNADGTLEFPLLNSSNPNVTNSSPFTWNSSVFTFTSASNYSNANGTNYIAYAWRSIEGYSSIGGYTGNGSTDGPFVYTGFRPAFVMFRNTERSANWWMYDTKRNPYNVMNLGLRADVSDADYTLGFIDCLSNGFKLRATGGDGNYSGSTIIYMAFAESPFKYSSAR